MSSSGVCPYNRSAAGACKALCPHTPRPPKELAEQPPLPGMQAPVERKFHNAGKQVLYNNTHYADAKDVGAAEFICHVLNAAVE